MAALDDQELAELKHMVMSFRVSELQVLLGSAGRNKSGRKHDLLSRALQLLKNGCTSQIQVRVRELYQRRFPRSKTITPTFNLSSNDKRMEFNESKMKRGVFLKPSKPPIHPDVTFKGLPFYDVISDVLKPSSLISRPSHECSRSDFSFTLSEEQVRIVKESQAKDTVKRYQVQIQLRFCLLETTCEQKDFLPPNLSVHINKQSVHLPPFVPPSKAGVDPRRANVPIDITMCCRLCDVSHNRLEATWMSNHGKNYALCINVVRPLSSDILLQRLRKKGVRSSGHSQALISEKLSRDPDSEIATTSLKVSLLCPLGKMRMTIPARPITCTHMQCFDAMLFLQMNERKPTWTCPVCDKPTEFSALFIDGLFVDILNDTSSEEIIFLDDGRWEPFKTKTECLSLCTPSKKADMIALDLSNSPKSSPSRLNGSKRKEPVIIDLTGDSSDEEDRAPSPPKRKNVDRDQDEIHSLSSSTSPYPSDNSVHRDDLAAPPQPKRGRSPKDDMPWDNGRDISFNGIPGVLGPSSSSPRPANFSTDRTAPIGHSLPSVYTHTGPRNDASPVTMYPYNSFDPYPALDFNSMSYFLSHGFSDPLRRMPGDHSARSSPYLNQQSHLSSNENHLPRSLYQNPYYLPENTDIIPID